MRVTAGRKTHVDPNRRRLRFSRRSTFDLSRYMGASLTMIDRHYGHLARDGREHAIKLLDALNAPEFQPWTLVDAAWTPKRQNGVTAENKKVELPV